MKDRTVKKLILTNIIIGVITVIEVTYVLSNFGLYLNHVLLFDIIATFSGMAFAITMFLWAVGMKNINNIKH
jgi:hypothetical protein